MSNGGRKAMATLATIFKRSDAMARGSERAGAIRAESDPFRLRALPNDDIYFYSKRIDNSRVVRQADPAARGECWSAVGAAAVVLMIGAQHHCAACGVGARRLQDLNL